MQIEDGGTFSRFHTKEKQKKEKERNSWDKFINPKPPEYQLPGGKGSGLA